MPVCARAVQQQDGTSVLVLDTAQTDVAACTYVVQSGPEVLNSLFAFSAEDGALVSVAIVSTWAAAWAVRSVIDVVRGSTNNET